MPSGGGYSKSKYKLLLIIILISTSFTHLNALDIGINRGHFYGKTGVEKQSDGTEVGYYSATMTASHFYTVNNKIPEAKNPSLTSTYSDFSFSLDSVQWPYLGQKIQLEPVRFDNKGSCHWEVFDSNKNLVDSG